MRIGLLILCFLPHLAGSADLKDLRYAEVQKNGFYTRLSCGFEITSENLQTVPVPIRMSPLSQSLTPVLARKRAADECRLLGTQQDWITRVRQKLTESNDVNPRQRKVLEVMEVAQKRANLKEQTQLKLMYKVKSCLESAPEKNSTDCQNLVGMVVGDLRDRQTLARKILNMEQGTPEIELPAPLLGSVLTKTWGQAQKLQPFSDLENQRVEQITAKSKDLNWLMEQVKTKESAMTAYYYLISKSPILTAFPNAEISDSELIQVLGKRISDLEGQIKNRNPNEMSTRELLAIADMDSALKQAKTKMPRDDFIKLCLDVDAQLLALLYSEEYLERDLLMAASIMSLAAPELAAPGRIAAKKVIEQIVKSSMAYGSAAGALAGVENFSKIQALDQQCSRWLSESKLDTKSMPLCRTDHMTKNLDDMQLSLAASAVLGGGLWLTPKLIQFVKGVRLKKNIEDKLPID